MNILTIVTIGFLVLEAANVIVLYFFPETKYANGVGIFKAWENSKRDSEILNFVLSAPFPPHSAHGSREQD